MMDCHPWWERASYFCRNRNDHQLFRSFDVNGILPSMILSASLVCPDIGTSFKKLKEILMSGYCYVLQRGPA